MCLYWQCLPLINNLWLWKGVNGLILVCSQAAFNRTQWWWKQLVLFQLFSTWAFHDYTGIINVQCFKSVISLSFPVFILSLIRHILSNLWSLSGTMVNPYNYHAIYSSHEYFSVYCKPSTLYYVLNSYFLVYITWWRRTYHVQVISGNEQSFIHFQLYIQFAVINICEQRLPTNRTHVIPGLQYIE